MKFHRPEPMKSLINPDEFIFIKGKRPLINSNSNEVSGKSDRFLKLKFKQFVIQYTVLNFGIQILKIQNRFQGFAMPPDKKLS